jgi:Holliday junction DNA helicase RuvA
MISSLTGKVKSSSATSLVVEISGIGILVNVPARISAQANLGSNIELHTYLIVREDALTLYGFLDLVDRNFFELLLSVTGIGPKVAQAILSLNNAGGIATAISKSDLKLLESIPGLGKKGAQRLVLELKDKVGAYANSGGQASNGISDQVEMGLQGLGYTSKESKDAVAQIRDEIESTDMDLASAMKLALQSTGKSKK